MSSQAALKYESGRMFRYDLIRALAALMIVLYHYNVEITAHGITAASLFTDVDKNVILNNLGLQLFFLLSGEMSEKSFSREIEKRGSFKKAVIAYYKKRLLAILPMYWIAYMLFFSAEALPAGTLPGKRIVFTLLGLDGYLTAHGVSTLYMLGEWFIGAILILYAVFPLIWLAVKRFPLVTAVFLGIFEILSVILCRKAGLTDQDVLIYAASFGFGICFSRYIRRIRPQAVIISAILLLILFLVKLPLLSQISSCLKGVSLYVVLLYVGGLAEKCGSRLLIPGKSFFSFIAKYSYPVFLVHHRIVNWFLGRITAGTYLSVGLYLLQGLAYLMLTLFFAVCVYGAHQHIMGFFKPKEKTEGI